MIPSPRMESSAVETRNVTLGQIKAGKEAGIYGRQIESGEDQKKLEALQAAGKLKMIPFADRAQMKKLADPVMADYAKEIGADYWADMAKVHSQSPHAFAATMRTPTLVIHGALDYRVPDAQGLAYYNTLKAKGVDARLVWFPDENHWILKPRNSRLWYDEYFAWLERHTPRAR